MQKIFLPLITLLFWGSLMNAQVISTEDFEDETMDASTFSSNGQVFSISSQNGGTFDVFNDATPFGWNGTSADNKFIDNSGSTTFNGSVQFTIATQDQSAFNVRSLWVYLSNSNLTSLGSNGSITFTGKKDGQNQFTVSSSSGFNTNANTNNGFSFIDFSSFGGSNNTDKEIDELVITTTSVFAYCALDAFSWRTVPEIVNNTPTELNLSNTSIDENVAVNTVIGNLNTTDPDAGDTHTYSLVTGSGSTDNASFNINGNQLRISSSPDFESQNTYAVRIRTTDQGGLFFEKSFTININDVCEPSDVAKPSANAQSFCGDATVADLTANGANIKWYNDESSSNALSNSAALNTAIYYATQTMNNCESEKQSFLVTVNETPSAPLVMDQDFCDSAKVEDLQAMGSNLKWYNTANNIAELANNTALSSGAYAVSQTLNNCESEKSTFNVSITASPEIIVAAVEPVCAGSEVTLNASGANEIVWNNNVVNGEAFVPTESGVYEVYGSNGACDSEVETVNVVVKELPQATITHNPSTDSLSTEAFDSYQWYLNNNSIDEATTQQILAEENGIYKVVVMQNGCEGTSEDYNLMTVGTTNPEASAGIQLYPNPASNVLNVKFNNAVPVQSSLNIYDLNGKLLQSVFIHQNEQSINIATLPNGVYVIQIIGKNINKSQKIVVQK